MHYEVISSFRKFKFEKKLILKMFFFKKKHFQKFFFSNLNFLNDDITS